MKPKTRKVDVADLIVDNLSKEKLFECPQVENLHFIPAVVLADEIYSNNLIKLSAMEDTLMVEVKDNINLVSSKKKKFQEFEFDDDMHTYIPSYQYCDRSSMFDMSLLSLQSPQLGLQEGAEAIEAMTVTSKTDLFDEVRRLRQFSLERFRK